MKKAKMLKKTETKRYKKASKKLFLFIILKKSAENALKVVKPPRTPTKKKYLNSLLIFNLEFNNSIKMPINKHPKILTNNV